VHIKQVSISRSLPIWCHRHFMVAASVAAQRRRCGIDVGELAVDCGVRPLRAGCHGGDIFQLNLRPNPHGPQRINPCLVLWENDKAVGVAIPRLLLSSGSAVVGGAATAQWVGWGYRLVPPEVAVPVLRLRVSPPPERAQTHLQRWSFFWVF
jgi:hypothetical protein